jgi:hypothetical protein
MQPIDHPFDQATRIEPTNGSDFRGCSSESYWNFVRSVRRHHCRDHLESGGE